MKGKKEKTKWCNYAFKHNVPTFIRSYSWKTSSQTPSASVKQLDPAACSIKEGKACTERLSICVGRKGYALKAMPKAYYFPFTDTQYLIFLTVFRLSILLLMKQKNSKKNSYAWLKIQSFSFVIHNCIFTQHGHWHLHTPWLQWFFFLYISFLHSFLPIFLYRLICILCMAILCKPSISECCSNFLYKLESSICYFYFLFP